MSKLHFTMILSGAIALGSYEAGVVSQIAYAFEQWNQENLGSQLIIDAISGASAGSMTGAMLARHLSLGTPALNLVKDNLAAWCTDTTFENLIRTTKADHNSVLSSTFIDNIAANCIASKPSQQDPGKGREVILSCALTALNPIPFEFNVSTPEHSVKLTDRQARIRGVTYRDGMTFRLNDAVWEIPENGSMELASDWSRVARVATASGSIPIAWEPMLLKRKPAEYDPKWKSEFDEVGVAYSDGGQIDNMPLDRAAGILAYVNDPGSDNTRIHILIIPDPPSVVSDAVTDPAIADGRAGLNWEFEKVLGRVYDAVSEQSFYRDLYQAQKINERIEFRNTFLTKLVARSVAAVTDIPAGEQEATETIAALLSHLPWPADPAAQQAEQERVDQFIANLKSSIDPGSAVDLVLQSVPNNRQDLFLLSLAAADIIGDLDNKCRLQVAQISPENANVLAGRAMGHFAGLVDSRLMLHDFNCGVADALTWLASLKASQGGIGEFKSLFEAGLVVDKVGSVTANSSLSWQSLSKDEKDAVKDDLIQRIVNYAADELHADGFVRGSLHFLSTALEGFVHFPN